MEKPLASKFMEALVALDPPINELSLLVAEITDPDERRGYIQAVGDVMGHVYGKLMIPILRGYPDLDPDKSRRDQPVAARKVLIRDTIWYHCPRTKSTSSSGSNPFAAC